MVKKTRIPGERLFPSAKQDASNVYYDYGSPQSKSPSYRLSYNDLDFIMRDELRPVRMQLEWLKPELTQMEHRIEATVVVFGSARIYEPDRAAAELCRAESALADRPGDTRLQAAVTKARRLQEKSKYYQEARQLGALITEDAKRFQQNVLVVTGGGPGIMEAANRGAADVGGKSMGFNIVLPGEQEPNRYITPDLCFQFHYFALRKMHFLMRAIALVIFPGGYGTLDELFEALTLIQTQKIRRIPVILFGRLYWDKIINFDALVLEGVISAADRELISYAETAEQAWQMVLDNYSFDDGMSG